MILMTGHRRESFDGGLARICRAMARIACERTSRIVFPVHRNPNVRRAIEPLRRHANVLLTEPVDYPELVFLLKRCHFVVTDSGRDSGGGAVLWKTGAGHPRHDRAAGGHGAWAWPSWSEPTSERLFDEMTALLDDPQAYSRMSRVENPYGDGRASRRIAARLVADERRFAGSPLRRAEPG